RQSAAGLSPAQRDRARAGRRRAPAAARSRLSSGALRVRPSLRAPRALSGSDRGTRASRRGGPRERAGRARRSPPRALPLLELAPQLATFANSTRRFIARPSGLSLGAKGAPSPLPSVTNRSAPIPNCSFNTLATAAARRF